MNRYLIEISRYFGGKIKFTIEALDKKDAFEKASLHVRTSHEFNNCKKDTMRVVKKLQNK